MSHLPKFYGPAHHPFGRRVPKEAVYRHGGFDEALSVLQMSVEFETSIARPQPLSAEETPNCVKHRLNAAENENKALLDGGAFEAVFDVTSRVPRSINGVATGAMIVAAALKQLVVTARDDDYSHADRGRSSPR